VLLTHRDCPRQPTWLDGLGPEPLECIAARNGVLHLPSILDVAPEPIPPTPRFFTANAITYAFSPEAPRPGEWLDFLASLWPDDPDSIACLQEWFGYLLTADTRQQKMLMLIGPTRSARGRSAACWRPPSARPTSRPRRCPAWRRTSGPRR
jgi:putative DNA primase/helicase